MIDLSSDNLIRIKANKYQSLGTTPIEVFPYYNGLNLVNIPNSVCRWFNIPTPRTEVLDIPDLLINYANIKNIVLLLIDGLSYERMSNWLYRGLNSVFAKPLWRMVRENAIFTPLTSVVPSTTANALTSLWTGKMPAEHGVIGYELFLREYDLILNMILQEQVYPNPSSVENQFKSDNFLPMKTLGSHFAQNGVRSYAFQHESIFGSGLSRMLFPDVNRVPYSSPEEMWQKAEELLDTHSKERRYVYLYWSDLDTLSHRHGPDSKRVKNAWNGFSHLLERFISARISKQSTDTVLLITSDHGQLPAHIRPRYDVRNDQEFNQLLSMPPSGESRFPYLFVKPDKEGQFQHYVSQRWQDEFTILPSTEILSSGILGEKQTSPVIQNRLGDHVALPKADAYWWWANKENHLLGRHGGFSAQEMITPLLILPI